MKIKALLLSTLFMTPFMVSASPERCDFDSISGELFEFSQPLPILMRHDAVDIVQAGIYPFWYKESNTANPISVESYFGRLAKIRSQSPVKRVSENTFKDVRERRHVRYYSAVADNCEQVYVRIIENDFPQYFSNEVDFSSHQFDFLEQERWVGITMLSNLSDLDSEKISHVTVRPEGDGKVFFINDVGSSYSSIGRYETVEVFGVRRTPMYLKGDMLSNYGIKVKYKGEQGYINGDYRYLFNGNPLLNVNPKFINAISQGKLSFGMDMGDVLLSWGMPKFTEVFTVYETFQGYEVDYKNSLAGKGLQAVGRISHWHFDGIESPIIFNVRGIFDEGRQRFSRFDPLGLPAFIME